MKIIIPFVLSIDLSNAQTSKSAKGLTCAPGWTLAGDRCMFREEIDFMCDGKKWSRSENSCVKILSKKPEAVCEPGYYLKQVRTVDKNEKIVGKHKEKNCASKEKVDAILSCPEGFILESRKKCVKQEVIPALGQDCGGLGFSNTGVLGDGTLACPLGSTYDKKTHACWIYEEIRPQRLCPYPYVQFGEVSTGWRCQLRDRMPVAFTCGKEGYELSEDGIRICIKRVYNDKKKFCPHGWILTRGTAEELDILLARTGGDFQKKDAFRPGFNIVQDKCIRTIYDLPLEYQMGGKGIDIKSCKVLPQGMKGKLLGEVRVEHYDPPEIDIEGLFVDILE